MESRIKLALRLGWVLAEVYGRMTQPNIRWQTMFSKSTIYPVSRLFLSTRQSNNGEALYVDLQLLTYLVEKLYPPVNSSPEYKLYNDCRLPKSISDFVEQINAAMLNHENNSVVPSSSTFHDLNHWSKQITSLLFLPLPPSNLAAQLAQMAIDPDIQLEMSAIDAEFATL